MGKKAAARDYVTMECSVCSERNYRTEKNSKTTEKLDLNKYCPRCRKHTPHKERKK